jgi:hypothetical protein
VAGRGAGWLLGAVRAEDGILAAWVVALPLVASWFGVAPAEAAGREAPTVVIGLVQLVAVFGALAALLTRPAGQVVRIGDAEAPRWIIAGPLVGGLAFAVDGAFENLGIGLGGWVMGLAFLAILVGSMAADRLPVVPAELRRLFVLPFILVCATYFNGFAADVLEGLNVDTLLASSPAGDIGFAIFILGMLLAGMAVFYTMFVVAPRELADPEESGPKWVVRFVLFMAASLLGVGWLSLLAP